MTRAIKIKILDDDEERRSNNTLFLNSQQQLCLCFLLVTELKQQGNNVGTECSNFSKRTNKMDVTLLSGVVRNRKVSHVYSRPLNEDTDGIDNPTRPPTLWDYFPGTALLRNFNLRVHKFTFQWDLAMHLSVCLASLTPFLFSGNRLYAILPISVWAFYNILVLIGTRRANLLVPGFGRFKHTFKASVEEFFSPKLLPVLSFSFLLVALSLAVTGRRLGGPPLCYSSCGKCLSTWEESRKLAPGQLQTLPAELQGRVGCGYVNGREMLGYYTMAQVSLHLFMSVIVAIAVCMAWRIADDELAERQVTEECLGQHHNSPS